MIAYDITTGVTLEYKNIILFLSLGDRLIEARKRLKLQGLQVDLGKEFENGMHFSHSSLVDKGELLDANDVLSLTSSDLAASALLALSQDEQDEAVETQQLSKRSQPTCPTSDELLELTDLALHAKK